MQNRKGVPLNDVKHLLYDEFGNRIRAYEIEVFDKCSDGNWRKTETTTSLHGAFYVLDVDQEKKVFHKVNDNLFPLNMDFNSPSCHRCYSVGKEIPVVHKVVGNEIIAELKNKRGALYKLKRQDYSDGPSFYYFIDPSGDFRVNHGNHDLDVLFEVLKKAFAYDPVLSDGIKNLWDSLQKEVKPSLDSRIHSASTRTGELQRSSREKVPEPEI